MDRTPGGDAPHHPRAAGARGWRAAAAVAAVVLGLALARGAAAEVVADWGTVSTPIESDITFSFAQNDVTTNFSHDYVFSLEGSADATYSVTFMFDACRNGCGSPVIEFGLDGNLGAGGGTYLLSVGTHTFTVTGTGMGSGNSVDYWGQVVINGGDIVAPVPELNTVVLLGAGLALIVPVVRRRRARQPGLVPGRACS